MRMTIRALRDSDGTTNAYGRPGAAVRRRRHASPGGARRSGGRRAVRPASLGGRPSTARPGALPVVRFARVASHGGATRTACRPQGSASANGRLLRRPRLLIVGCGDVGRRLDAPLTLFVALGLKRLAGMLAALGEPDAERYRAEAARMAGAAHAAFWHEDQSAYAAYRNAGGAWHFAELTQALAVCAGACPPECLDAALAALAGGQLAEVTLSHTVFLFDALMTRPARYARLMMGRVARDWGDMLARGATTFWETKKGAADFGRAGSLCHGWSAVPAYLYFAYALGIRPTRPGFAEYAVQPVPCGLYELSGRVVTREGKVIDLPEGAGR